MSLRNSKRNRINNFIWFCSGLNVRELSSLYQSRSNYFGIGGINIFSTLIMLCLSIWSASIAFPNINLLIPVLIGLILSLVLFIFNRQTVSALSIADKSKYNRKHTLTFLPILVFSVFIGVVVSTPIKLELLEIPGGSGFFERLKILKLNTEISFDSNSLSYSITLITILIAILPTLMQYYTLRSNFQQNRSSFLNELLWFCSGANREIIRKCPNDHSKYFGIGGTILFTALMATLSGGYAFNYAFHNTNLAIYFGIFWGAMIFNLDRFIVNTMYSDNKHSISWLEILSGLPRIIIAIFLGIVITYPLELKIYEDEITSRIDKLKLERKTENDSLSKRAFSSIYSDDAEIKMFEQKKERLNLEGDSIKKILDRIVKVDQYWYTDSLGPHYHKVWPPSHDIEEGNYNRILLRNAPDIANLQNRIQERENAIAATKSTKEGYDKIHNSHNEALDDLSAQMEAFSKLKEEKESVATSSLFIMLLLIIIEISPVFLKMMLSSGDYEVRLEADKNDIKMEELVRMSKKNDWANLELLKTIEENKASLASNVELLNSIAKAQSEIAQVAIEKWKEHEIKEAEENPGNIIYSNKNHKKT
jgi:hypothetical protein